MARKEVATQNEDQDLALFGGDRPDWVGDTARGSEQVSTNDLTLPRLSIIQDLSPQRKRDKAEYIEGAAEGMLFNTATGELYPNGSVIVVPCFFRAEHTVWKDRNQGGGFGGAFDTEEAAQAWIEQQENPAAWDVNYTHQHFCVMVLPGHTAAAPKLQDIVISMSKSQLKPSRKWNTMAQQLGGDRFSRAYRLSVVQDRSEKGEFFNWSAQALGYVPEEIYKRGEAVYEAVKSGARDVSRADVDRGQAERHDPSDM